MELFGLDTKLLHYENIKYVRIWTFWHNIKYAESKDVTNGYKDKTDHFFSYFERFKKDADARHQLMIGY